MDPIELIFHPETVAVVGASNDLSKWGAGIFDRVLNAPSVKRLYPVNKNATVVQGVKAYPSIKDLPEPVDFVAIVIPYPDVPQVVRECVEKGVKTALIITAGLGETGAEGARIESEIVGLARQGGMRMVGPNCMGHFNSHIGFSTLRMSFPIDPGQIGVISQSGGFGMHILTCGIEMGVGFSKFVSVGNEADLHFEDFLEYYARDEKTKVIVGYIEGLRKGREFLRMAKEITRKKPIVVVKVGKTGAGAKAARSHTSAIAGSDIIYDAVFKQAGVIRVETVEELFDVAAALLKQPLPKGNRVGILTGGGGFGCVTSDASEKLGLKVVPLSPETIEKLNHVLPDRWPHGNPVDTVATSLRNVTYQCIGPLMEDPNLDSVLVIGGIGVGGMLRFGVQNQRGGPPAANSQSSQDEITQQMLNNLQKQELENLDKLFELMDRYQKPLVISGRVPEAMKETPFYEKLRNRGVVMYPTPERAVAVVARLVQYSQYLNGF